MRQLLFNRGITTAESALAYLGAESPTDTNPFALKDMDKAVMLIHEAVENNQKIAIYGDYDTDGVTSSALLYEFFDQLGHTPRVYIPNRFDEGYGLNLDAIQQLASEGINLLITVDCGSALEEVALAKQLGMKVVVTDHHSSRCRSPDADAVIDPHQPGDPTLTRCWLAWHGLQNCQSLPAHLPRPGYRLSPVARFGSIVPWLISLHSMAKTAPL